MPFPNYAKLLPKIDLSKIDEQDRPAVRSQILETMKQAEIDYVNGLLKTDQAFHRTTFQGMLRYIARAAGRPDYNDVILMDQIEFYYNELCARYQQPYTIERYCILLNCSIDYYFDMVDNWVKRGLSGHIQRVKLCQTETISSMQDGAMTGNPGYIFILKAKHGWSDQPAPGGGQPEQASPTLEQIAAAVGLPSGEPLPLPETAGEMTSQDDILDV